MARNALFALAWALSSACQSASSAPVPLAATPKANIASNVTVIEGSPSPLAFDPPGLPACKQGSEAGVPTTNLTDDQIPAGYPTSLARLPTWHADAGKPSWVAREGRKLQVTRRDGSALGGGAFHAWIADGAGKRVRQVDVETMQVVADYALPGAPAQLAVDARPAAVGQPPVVWATLPDQGLVARLTTGSNPFVVTFAASAAPTALALADLANPALPESVELVVVGVAAPPRLQWMTVAGQVVHEAALPAPAVALRAPLVTKILAVLASGPAVLIAPHWTDVDTGHPKSSGWLPLARRTHNPAQVRAVALEQVFAPMSSGTATAAACAAGNCFVGHGLAFNGAIFGTAPTKTYGGAAPPALDLCKALPVRPLEPTVSAYGAAGQLLAAKPADPVRDPDTFRNYLARFDGPTDMARLRSADVLAVAMATTGNALLLTLYSDDPMVAPVGELVLGPRPDALVEVPPLPGAPPRMLALDTWGTTLRRIPLEPLRQAVAQLGAFAYLSKPIRLHADATLAVVADALPAKLHRGRELFFVRGAHPGLARGDRFVCASCHPGGLADGLQWSSPNGTLNTPALAGRLNGTAPYGWKGEEPTVAEHLSHTVNRLEGNGIAASDRDALAAFVASLALPVGLAAADVAAVERGRAVFLGKQAQCGVCHPPPHYQDGLAHDVGTGGALNTPSLLGLFATAPYLHDGRAPTLHDALAQTAHTMGDSASLTAAQRADLLAFLATL
ncbi:MAG: hypothetical protein FJ100_13165 [Deltaproteobacteria bacterium]|nr:hypothetical protein [Deltaproteobacteria bacterium]